MHDHRRRADEGHIDVTLFGSKKNTVSKASYGPGGKGSIAIGNTGETSASKAAGNTAAGASWRSFGILRCLMMLRTRPYPYWTY